MPEIKLDEHYSIIPDASCWILSYRKEGPINPNTRKPSVSRDDSYWGQLQHALQAYVDRSLKECTSVKEIIERLKETSAFIEKVVENACDGPKLLKQVTALENQLANRN